MTRSYVGAYWGSRAQSVDACAKLIAALITELAVIDPVLSGWRSGANSKRAAMAQPQVTTEYADLTGRLMAGRNRNDDGAVIEELGYTVGWWNGSENNKTSADLLLIMGATSQWVGNAVTINLPDSVASPGPYTPANAQALLTTVIDIFTPDHAVWTNHPLVDLQREPDRPNRYGGFTVGQLIGHPAGWATFLADSEPIRFDPGRLPASARVERVGNGTLVLLGEDSANPPPGDVLAVRAAMGYPIAPRAQEGSQSAAAAGSPGSAAPSESTLRHEAARQAEPPSAPTEPDGSQRSYGGS